MEFDTSIYSRSKPNKSTLDKLSDLASAERQQQESARAATRAQRETEAYETEQSIKDLAQQNVRPNTQGTLELDTETFLSDLAQIDPLKAAELGKTFKEEAATTSRKKREAMLLAETQQKAAKNLLWGIVDEPSYQRAREEGIRLGLPGAEKVPTTYDPAFVEDRKMALLNFQDRQNLQRTENQKISGQRTVDLAEERFKTGQAHNAKVMELREQAAARADAVQKQTKQAASNSIELQLASAVKTNLKDFAEVKQAYGRLKAAGQQYAVGGKGVTDVALINGFMRMIDPGGVVRPSDVENIMLARGVPERVALTIANWKQGDLLPKGVREEIAQVADDLYNNAEADAIVLAEEFRQRATLYPGVRQEALGLEVASAVFHPKKGGKTFTYEDVLFTSQQQGVSVADVVKRIRESGGGLIPWRRP